MLCLAWIIPFVVGAFIHLTGIVETVAPFIGGVGSVLVTIDESVADVTKVRTYIQKRRLEKTVSKLHPVVVPTKAPKKASRHP